MKIKRGWIYVLLVSAALALAGCGESKAGTITTGRYHHPQNATATEKTTEEGGTPTETEDKTAIPTELFLIRWNDMRSEGMILEQLASGKQYMYEYSVVTRFLDKYGNSASASDFDPGKIVILGGKDSAGRLEQVQISDQVWEYPNVKRFSVDEERGVFEIAGTSYSFDESVYVNSDGNLVALGELTELDTLRVIGLDKRVLSVSITTGHGELQLSNTELFEGSYIQIGQKIFAKITPDMKIELPEGEYTVAVANNGYGGSTDIKISRGYTEQLDLDTLKGEGPKYGKILFAVDVEGAILQIDGEVVDYKEVVPVQYGVHTITVTADAYQPYSKRLYVNSKEATIVISLTGENTAASGSNTGTNANAGTGLQDGGQTASEAAGMAGSLAGSQSGNRTAGAGTGSASANTGGIDEAELNAIIDGILNKEENSETSNYLTTLTELLSSITGEKN